jgi:hypothetical protein
VGDDHASRLKRSKAALGWWALLALVLQEASRSRCSRACSKVRKAICPTLSTSPRLPWSRFRSPVSPQRGRTPASSRSAFPSVQSRSCGSLPRSLLRVPSRTHRQISQRPSSTCRASRRSESRGRHLSRTFGLLCADVWRRPVPSRVRRRHVLRLRGGRLVRRPPPRLGAVSRRGPRRLRSSRPQRPLSPVWVRAQECPLMPLGGRATPAAVTGNGRRHAAGIAGADSTAAGPAIQAAVPLAVRSDGSRCERLGR